MATTWVHERITKRQMKRFGLSERACEIAATVNKLVDGKQDNSPEETHLHAMRGMVRDNSGQLAPETRESAVKATRMLVEGAKKRLIDDIRKMASVEDCVQRSLRGRAVLESLGSALHTVQDTEFHDFGTWLHAGIGQALVIDPVGTGLHGVHDLGSIEATVGSGANRAGRWGVAADVGFVPSRRMAERDIGFFVQGAYKTGGAKKMNALLWRGYESAVVITECGSHLLGEVGSGLLMT